MSMMSEYEMSEFDIRRINNLRFSTQDIEALQYAVNSGLRVTTQNMTCMLGFSYELANKVHYMYNICVDKISIDTIDDLSKHLRKISNCNKIGIQNFPVSSINKIPRTAVIGGIPNGPLAIFNSSNYKGKDMLYVVSNVTSKNVIFRTRRRPSLRQNDMREVPGIIKITGANDKIIEIEVNRENCRLCNRFIIFGSTRRPETHHGMWTLLAFEGTKVYVYAQSLGVRDSAKYSISNQRVYDYGFFSSDIRQKLDTAANKLNSMFSCVYSEFEDANSEFKSILPKERKTDEYGYEMDDCGDY